ncbi:MAG: YggT family protein [Eubacterium sp.]|nr:YggT family protein [Eubacterium sp.]
MALVLARAVSWFGNIFVLLLCARAILSWFAADPYSPARKFYELTIALTEPLVSVCRNFLSRFNTGMFDFSLLLAMLFVQFATRIIVRAILMFMI